MLRIFIFIPLKYILRRYMFRIFRWLISFDRKLKYIPTPKSLKSYVGTHILCLSDSKEFDLLDEDEGTTWWKYHAENICFFYETFGGPACIYCNDWLEKYEHLHGNFLDKAWDNFLQEDAVIAQKNQYTGKNVINKHDLVVENPSIDLSILSNNECKNEPSFSFDASPREDNEFPHSNLLYNEDSNPAILSVYSQYKSSPSLTSSTYRSSSVSLPSCKVVCTHPSSDQEAPLSSSSIGIKRPIDEELSSTRSGPEDGCLITALELVSL
jgi:hypothetical protein